MVVGLSITHWGWGGEGQTCCAHGVTTAWTCKAVTIIYTQCWETLILPGAVSYKIINLKIRQLYIYGISSSASLCIPWQGQILWSWGPCMRHSLDTPPLLREQSLWYSRDIGVRVWQERETYRSEPGKSENDAISFCSCLSWRKCQADCSPQWVPSPTWHLEGLHKPSASGHSRLPVAFLRLPHWVSSYSFRIEWGLVLTQLVSVGVSRGIMFPLNVWFAEAFLPVIDFSSFTCCRCFQFKAHISVNFS